MGKIFFIAAFTVFLSLALPVTVHAQDAMQDLGNAASSGEAAVNSSSDEDAKSKSNEVFDTPVPPPVDTNSPSEGSSGLSNAPTYNEGSGSGLSNAPTP